MDYEESFNEGRRELVPFKETTVALNQVQKPVFTAVQLGRKISKVRWLQKKEIPTIPDPFAKEFFVAATNKASMFGTEENKLTLNGLAIDSDNAGLPVGKISVLSEFDIDSRVTDLVALNDEMFAVTTNKGCLSIYRCPRYDAPGDIEHDKTKELHLLNDTLPCPARSLSHNDSSIATVGEDGCIFLCDCETFQVSRSILGADKLSIYCVEFVGFAEILTGNAGGHLKLWDLRTHEDLPVHVLKPNIVMNNLRGAISIAQHPSQTHLIIAGYQSGGMDLFDLRMASGAHPVANLSSDTGSLREVFFHQVNPDHFYSCSQVGQLLHWYPDVDMIMPDSVTVPEVNIEFLRRGLVFTELVRSPLPINSMNISVNDRLICGGDIGAVFCTEIINT